MYQQQEKERLAELLVDARALGAAIEEGDPQTIADAWLRVKAKWAL